MSARPRIDLDGVPLVDEHHPPMVIAVLRYRTTEGIVLLVPESADVLVPWQHVESATVNLATGEVRVVLRAPFVERQPWLRGAGSLVGRWTDRYEMSAGSAARLD